MTRRQSVAFCLLDVGFLSDPKFRNLARRLPAPNAFNSAVGAYFIALAASRRNGSHRIDFAVETESAYLPDLEAVGLTTDGGFPAQAWEAWRAVSATSVAGGLARAASATRVAGRFTSDTSIDQPAGVLEPLVQPSPPLHSTLSRDLRAPARMTADERTVLVVGCPECLSLVGQPCKGVRPERNGEPWSRWAVHRTRWEGFQAGLVPEQEPDDGRLDLEAWLLVKRRIPTPRQRDFLDAYCRTFDVTGPARAERIILTSPDDPIAALKADLDAFRAERVAAAKAAEVKPPQPSRGKGGLTGINKELAEMFREQYDGEGRS